MILSRRSTINGATVGLAIGIAIAVILLILVTAFFVVYLRRRRASSASSDHEGTTNAPPRPEEKKSDHNIDTGDASRKNFSIVYHRPIGDPVERPSMPRRNKSVKDRLMGPLYRESMIDMTSIPKVRVPGETSGRLSTVTLSDGASVVSKPWTDQSPRPSFSSRRATRIMMMM